MVTPYLGELRPFAGNFAPRNWVLANGQLMSISQNTALFSLIGTTYGGNGVQTFALPNLQGTLAINQGQGPGLTARTLGEVGGSENVTLLQGNLPIHNHSLNAVNTPAVTGGPGPTVLTGVQASPDSVYVVPGTPAPTPVHLAPQAVGITGGSQSHPNMMPALVISYIMSLSGIFPSRN